MFLLTHLVHDSGVVDQHVQTTPAGGDLAYGTVDAIFRGYVGLDEMEVIGRDVVLIVLDVEHGDFGTGFSEKMDDCKTNAR